MIRDALTRLPAEIEADVCICGAGPAGIVSALELARRGRRVVLVEGGGLDAPGDAQSVYDGELSGRPYPLLGSRLRWLGGTSNHWGGWVKPLDDQDFRDKPHYPMPAWPFGPEELRPWYADAARWCEIDSVEYTPESLGREAHRRLLGLEQSTGFTNRVFRFSPPTRFGRRYRDDLEQSENIDCLVNLNAVELTEGEDRVHALVARTVSGQQCTIRARQFVLAMGGIENARFLLNQQSVPGNHADLVGRCFMDHYGFTPGKMLSSSNLAYERGSLTGQDVMLVMSPTESLVGEGELRNSCIMLRADSPDSLLAPEYWESQLFGGEQLGGMHGIGMINEPLPHRQSRITLSDERDMLGMRRTHLHWHLPKTEFEPVLALFNRWTTAVSRAGLARVRHLKDSAPELSAHVGIGYHHMGTTRMSAAPEYGVSDADGRCWDRDNLYLAGSSLFPHVGYSNPTLTIVALAARLAEHLSGRLESNA